MQFKEMLDTLDSNQKKILIGIAVFLLLFIVCYKLIFQTAVRKVKYYNSKVAQETIRNSLRKDLGELNKVKKSYEDLVIHTNDIDIFKNNLSKLVSSHGAKILSISSKTRKAAYDSYDIFSTTIEFESSYDQLGEIVSSIENNKLFIKIVSLHLANPQAVRLEKMFKMPISAGPQQGSAKVRLVVETYSFREK